MSFLTPLFLLGGLAVSMPIVFHLIRRTTRQRTVFSSLMFLLPTPPRLTRRSRLEHLLLLALRCGVLCLLALGFSRPFFKRDIPGPVGPGAARTVLLVDTSASMRRLGLWPEALDKAKSVLKEASRDDQLAVGTFDRQVDWLLPFDQWNQTAVGERAALATQRLSAVHPGWSSTHLGDALISAAELLADTTGTNSLGPGRIVLITDLQEGSRLGTLQGYQWPKNVTLSVETLKPKRAGDVSIQWVPESENAAPKTATSVRLRVANAADSRRDEFKLGWRQAGGFLGKPLELYVPAGQSRIALLQSPISTPAPDRISIEGDDEDFDNTVFATAPDRLKLSVLYLGAEPVTDPKQPLFFLDRAFQETRRQTVKVIPHPPSSPVSPAEVDQASLIVVTAPLPDALSAALRNAVLAGKTALVVLRSEDQSATLRHLLGSDTLSVQEAPLKNYAMLAEIDFRHPLFVPFADPPFSDFTKIHFWKYRRFDVSALPGSRVLAKFDTGDPALVEVPLAKGRLILIASGWQPADSQFALSSKFVPFMYSLLEESGAPPPPPPQYFVGDTVPLAAGRENPLKVRTPDGTEVSLGAGETNFSKTLLPGLYTVSGHGQNQRFVVNLDPAESRLTPMAIDDLEKMGAPIARQAPPAAHQTERRIHLQNAELEARQKLWRWVIVLTLVVLLLETWLGGRTARQSSALGGAAS